MSMVRYEPWVGVRQLQDDINRLFSDWNSTDSSGVTADWVPSVDINEFEDKFQLYVDIPGVDPKPLPLDGEGPHDGGTGRYLFEFDGSGTTLLSEQPGGPPSV